MSPYVYVQGQTIFIDLVPDTVLDGLYNIIMVIETMEFPNKSTKRGFYVNVLNACNYIEYWLVCS